MKIRGRILYIILEYLILENFIINFFILYITKLITRTKAKIKRLVLGAFISSFYSLVFFNPNLIFLTKFYMKIILSLLIVKISFNSKDLKLFVKEILGFYVVSFLFAGATLGIFYSQNSGFLSKNVFTYSEKGFPVKYLIIGTILSLIFAKLLFEYHNKKISHERYITEVKIFYKNNMSKVFALIDTGNSLLVPFTNKPVFVVEYEKIKNLLPDKVSDLFVFYEKDDYKNFERVLRNVEEEVSIRLIPYRSIGNDKGIIFGFKPDYLLINLKDVWIKKDDFYIGIYNNTLSKDLSFSGLLHYETIRQEEAI